MYILALDQGTTGSTAVLITAKGRIKGKVNREFPQVFPKPGWVEHRPEDIWASVVQSIQDVLKKTKVKPQEILALGITNQRETVALWNRKTHKPVYNAIVWQCRRTTDFCRKLEKRKLQKTIQRKTGLVLDPYFSASKINWILKHLGLADKKALVAGTMDTYLLWKLTEGKVHKTDVSNASRTQLMNIQNGKWDKDLLKIFGVPAFLLPDICPSSGILGHTQNVPGLLDGTPIAGMAGDQQAALFGQSCFEKGEAKCTFGTGSFILMNTGSQKVSSHYGLLTTVAWQLSDSKPLTYALEGGAFICGASVQWLRDQMGFFKESSEIEKLASQVKDTAGVEFVPAFSGLGAPYWVPEARGLISGLTRGTQRAHVARAVLESMALQNVDILKAMSLDLGRRLKSLQVDGGGSQNNLLMQMQADYLGQALKRPLVIETTALGAGYLAGLGVGLWRDLKSLKGIWALERSFEPKISLKDRKKRQVSWKEAVGKTLWGHVPSRKLRGLTRL